MAFTKITVTGAYQDGLGDPLQGALTFTLTQAMTNSGVTIPPEPVTVQLATGRFAVALAATDDAGTVPQGVVYGVTEAIIGGQPRDYFIVAPAAAPGGTVDISTLMPGPVGWQ